MVDAIALLIDTENIQPREYEAVKHDLLKRGRVIVRRAYGEFGRSAGPRYGQQQHCWNEVLAADKVKRVNPAAHARGKNACDILLVIEAMDLLHNNAAIKTFAIVSSDSDFAPLADRIREAGKRVLGYGSRNTSAAFRTTVDVFTSFDALLPALPIPVQAEDGRLYGHVVRVLQSGHLFLKNENDGTEAFCLGEHFPKSATVESSVGARVSYKTRPSLKPEDRFANAYDVILEPEKETPTALETFTGHIVLLREKYGFIRHNDTDVYLSCGAFPENLQVGDDVIFCYRQRGIHPVAWKVKRAGVGTVQGDVAGRVRREAPAAPAPDCMPSAVDGRRIAEVAIDSLISDSTHGWVRGSTASEFIKRKHPDFDVRTWGFQNFRQYLLREFPTTYELTGYANASDPTFWIGPARQVREQNVENGGKSPYIEVGKTYLYQPGGDADFEQVRATKRRKLGTFNAERLDGSLLRRIPAEHLTSHGQSAQVASS